MCHCIKMHNEPTGGAMLDNCAFLVVETSTHSTLHLESERQKQSAMGFPAITWCLVLVE